MSSRLQVEFAGVPFKNPVVMASGTFGFGREYADLFDIEQLGAAGVGGVGFMNLTAGQLPDEPGFHRAEEEFSGLRPFTGAGDVIEQPLELRAGEIRVGHKTGHLADMILKPLVAQALDDRRSTAALPMRPWKNCWPIPRSMQFPSAQPTLPMQS